MAPNIGRMGKSRNCARCGSAFEPRGDCASRQAKYCSRECGWTAQKTAAETSIPTADELQSLHHDQGLSVAEIGRHYGKSDWWAKQALARRGVQQRSTRTGTTLACLACSASFYAKRSEIAKGRRYCSSACRYGHLESPATRPDVRAKISASKIGPRNPAFKDGLSEDTVRRRHVSIKIKGERRCRVCGTEGLLHLHHVIPRSMFKAGITEILNCIPLCPRCHAGWHHRSVTIHRSVFTAEEWAYLSSVELLGQRVAAWLDDRYPEGAVVANG